MKFEDHKNIGSVGSPVARKTFEEEESIFSSFVLL